MPPFLGKILYSQPSYSCGGYWGSNSTPNKYLFLNWLNYNFGYIPYQGRLRCFLSLFFPSIRVLFLTFIEVLAIFKFFYFFKKHYKSKKTICRLLITFWLVSSQCSLNCVTDTKQNLLKLWHSNKLNVVNNAKNKYFGLIYCLIKKIQFSI